MWDLPGPGIKPLFPTLADRFLTSGPPGKSLKIIFEKFLRDINCFSMLMLFIKIFLDLFSKYLPSTFYMPSTVSGIRTWGTKENASLNNVCKIYSQNSHMKQECWGLLAMHLCTHYIFFFFSLATEPYPFNRIYVYIILWAGNLQSYRELSIFD